MVVTDEQLPKRQLAALQVTETNSHLVDLRVQRTPLRRDLALLLLRHFVRKARKPIMDPASKRRDLALFGLESLEERLEVGLALFGHEAFLT
jgi:hypothetical protein